MKSPRPITNWMVASVASVAFCCASAAAKVNFWLETEIDERDALEQAIGKATDTHVPALVLFQNGLEAIITPVDDPAATTKTPVSLSATAKFGLSHRIHTDPKSGCAFASIVGDNEVHVLFSMDFVSWNSQQVTSNPVYFNSFLGLSTRKVFVGGYDATNAKFDIYRASTVKKNFSFNRSVTGSSGFTAVDSINGFPRAGMAVYGSDTNAVFFAETNDGTNGRIVVDCSNGHRQVLDTGIVKSTGFPESHARTFSLGGAYVYHDDAKKKMVLLATDCAGQTSRRVLGDAPDIAPVLGGFFSPGVAKLKQGLFFEGEEMHVSWPGNHVKVDIGNIFGAGGVRALEAASNKMGPYSLGAQWGTGGLVGLVPGSVLLVRFGLIEAAPLAGTLATVGAVLLLVWFGVRDRRLR
jgi:hypothetical protein